MTMYDLVFRFKRAPVASNDTHIELAQGLRAQEMVTSTLLDFDDPQGLGSSLQKDCHSDIDKLLCGHCTTCDIQLAHKVSAWDVLLPRGHAAPREDCIFCCYLKLL